MFKGVGVRFADLISFFTVRPNYFIFMGYLKSGVGGGFEPTP